METVNVTRIIKGVMFGSLLLTIITLTLGLA